MRTGRPILVLDSASPMVSLAIGSGEEILGQRQLDLRCSSERLLHTLEEMLRDAGRGLHDLDGIAALRGPGSFTGLRVGLGTVLGLHQALGLPATGLPTLPILATAGAGHPEKGAHEEHPSVLAVVDALRGSWYSQPFLLEESGAMPLAEPALRSGRELGGLGIRRIIGFGVEALRSETWCGDEVELLEPPPLAPLALSLATRPSVTWDPSLLTRPIYFRPPAVSQPKRRLHTP